MTTAVENSVSGLILNTVAAPSRLKGQYAMNNVVFDSPTMYVIDYAGQDAVEILDKRSGRVGLVRGALAQRFRHDFGILLSHQADAEEFEDFMDGYEAVMNQSARIH
jgi:hypothetical protein